MNLNTVKMSKEKSAVEWLVEILLLENEISLKGENLKLIEMANQMFEKQLNDSFTVGCLMVMTGPEIDPKEEAQVYYATKFKK